MNVSNTAEKCGFEIVAGEEALTRDITGVYCCDLLSFAMGRAPEDSAWITVMGNMNSVAVASLADVACIVLCDGVRPDAEMMKKAAQEDIAILCSGLPAFETGKMIFDTL